MFVLSSSPLYVAITPELGEAKICCRGVETPTLTCRFRQLYCYKDCYNTSSISNKVDAISVVLWFSICYVTRSETGKLSG